MSVRRPLRYLLFLAPLASGAAQDLSDFTTPLPIKPGEALIIGFLGGWEHWNDPHRGVRKLALRLREAPGVHAETVENHQRRVARELVEHALDWNANGRVDAGERAGARIILYGQSLGGAAVVKLAGELERMAIPVLLTVQIDSVGHADGVIPANVAAAANFYQREPFSIAGRPSIRAADPSHTRILGSFRFHYPIGASHPRPESWTRRAFGGGHARMEADPELWERVEALILEAAGSRAKARATILSPDESGSAPQRAAGDRPDRAP